MFKFLCVSFFFAFLLMDSFDFATDSPSSVGNRIVLITDSVEDKKSLTPGNHFLFSQSVRSRSVSTLSALSMSDLISSIMSSSKRILSYLSRGDPINLILDPINYFIKVTRKQQTLLSKTAKLCNNIFKI